VKENESYIVKAPDLGKILRVRNEEALEEFMKAPLAAVAGAVNDILLHPTTLASTAIRVAHATLKGQMFQQLASEIRDFQAKGKLTENFAENKNGYNTWVDLLKIIDDESPDEDRLEALKAMFFAANSMNASDGEKFVAYQLFQIAKTLSSNDLAVLMVLWKNKLAGSSIQNDVAFFDAAHRVLEHSVDELILMGYQRLAEMKLAVHYGLTRLGQTFCENIQKYQTS
jgi:hypothetical protein